MRKPLKSAIAVVCSLAFVGIVLVSGQDEAQARPQYLKAFAGKYEGLKAQAKEVKCGICHPEKKKKIRNNYGAAMKKVLEKKNEKDVEKINAALEKLEKQKSATKDKTFGDLIKEGKLPGTDKPAKEDDE